MTALRLASLLAIAGCALLVPAGAAAQAPQPGIAITFGDGTVTGRAIQLFLLLTVLSLAPGILMTVTCFTRIIVALSLLRTGLGAPGVPPNPVLISLAMFLSFFIMAPTFEKAWEAGVQPYTEGRINETQAMERSVAPFREFMLAHVRDEDLRLFADLAQERPRAREDVALTTLMPAFMISELRRAFEIGFLLLLPFLIIDLAVSAVLMAMGMMMLPPPAISLPIKIIFFVLVDGWALVAGSLIQSFGVASG